MTTEYMFVWEYPPHSRLYFTGEQDDAKVAPPGPPWSVDIKNGLRFPTMRQALASLQRWAKTRPAAWNVHTAIDIIKVEEVVETKETVL